MKKFKISVAALLALSMMSQSAFACTGFVAGKNVMADGNAIIARTEDLEGAHNKNFKVIPASTSSKPVVFKDVAGFTMNLPKNSYKHTIVCDSEQSEGIYDEVGFNEKGVALSATVSASANETALKADPLVETGLSEASMTTVILPYAESARDAVEKIAKIVDEKGSAEGNIIFASDKKESWYMEIYTGHQYAAVKIPDDKYAVVANHFMLGYVDLKDKDVIASKDLINLPKKNNFYAEHKKKFHAALTYGETMGDYDRVRVWGGQHKFSPSKSVPYDTKVFELWQTPDKKITLKDVMEFQRYRYEDTDKNANLEENKQVRAIGSPSSMECHIIQIKPYLPEDICGTMWLTMANAEHSVYVPFYGNINDTPAPYKVEGTLYDDSSFYWLMRNINVNSAKNREKYGANVRKYWSGLEDEMIKEILSTDKELKKIYKENGKDAAAIFATEDLNKKAGKIFEDATKINKELITYLAKDDAKSQKEPFMPSMMQK